MNYEALKVYKYGYISPEKCVFCQQSTPDTIDYVCVDCHVNETIEAILNEVYPDEKNY
jgi:hypothetical protein